MGRGGGGGRGGRARGIDRRVDRSIDPFRVRTRATRPRGGRTIEIDRAGTDLMEERPPVPLLSYVTGSPYPDISRAKICATGESDEGKVRTGARARRRASLRRGRRTRGTDGSSRRGARATRLVRIESVADGRRDRGRGRGRHRAREASRRQHLAARVESGAAVRRDARGFRRNLAALPSSGFWLALASGRMKPQPLC